MSGKPALRVRLRAARDAAAPSAPIPAPAPFLARLRAGAVVASYLPVGSEADPAAFVAAARAAGATLALPFTIDRATAIVFLRWAEDATLEAGPFGLANPPAAAEAVVPTIVLTPLVGFDRRGTRLGQGAAHYDRAFAALPGTWRIGIAWSVQECDALPREPWDVPLHAIATEREWIEVAA